MKWTASAPCRLDFAGGWTDVAPFADRHGGVVVNAAIEMRATAEVSLGGECHRLISEDLGLAAELRTPADYQANGTLNLLKAATKLSGVGPCQLVTRSAAPPGSGLGSSGALGVALLRVLDEATGVERSRPALALRAWQVESVEAGLPGGQQDQYAASLGGIHRFDFGSSGVAVEPLAIDPEFAAWLETHIVVCYTGQTRVSGDTIARVMGRYAAGDPVIGGALAQLVDTAVQMAAALKRGNPALVGGLLAANWRLQQVLDPGMATPLMAELAATMRQDGALGGKAAGAGAGGSMFFLMPHERRGALESARRLGIQVIPFRWANEGVRLW